MILISVHDVKAETWSNPTCDHTPDSARRSFGQFVSDPKLCPCPADFELYQVGEWKDNKIVPLIRQKHLASGVDYVRE